MLRAVVFLAAGSAVAAPPVNDSFAARLTLTGSPASTTGTNVQATREIGEPFHGPDDDVANSVWWQWTAPSSGRYIFSTSGSDFDTLLAVYTGNTVSSLTLMAANDDRDGFDYTSQVVIQGVEGTVYKIAVDGAYFRTGNISLAVSGPFLPPANDNFANRTTLAAAPLVHSSTTSLATRETGEPVHGGIASGAASVWWSWTPAVSGSVSLSITGSGFQPTLALYTGAAVNALTAVPVERISFGQAQTISCAVVAGSTYAIAADAAFGFSGNITLNIGSIIQKPINDDFAGRLMILENELQTASTVGATRQSEEVLENLSQGNTLWWTWTAPSNGRWRIDASSSQIIAYISLYSGSSVESLTRIARATSFEAGGPNELVFTAAQGQVFQIAISSLDEFFSATGVDGSVSFIIELEGSAPANDSFANARRILSAGTYAGSNLRAESGSQAGEPFIDDAGLTDIGGSSVWWRWTAPPGVSTVTIDTFGSDFDTVLAVYSGSLGSLTPVAVNDESSSIPGQSEVVFNAQAGITYQIAVNGFMGVQGNIQITLTGGGVVLADEAVAADVQSQMVQEGGNSYGAVTFTRKIGGGISYLVEVSNNLVDWDPTESQLELFGAPQSLSGGSAERVTFRVKDPITEGSRIFMRLVLTQGVE